MKKLTLALCVTALSTFAHSAPMSETAPDLHNAINSGYAGQGTSIYTGTGFWTDDQKRDTFENSINAGSPRANIYHRELDNDIKDELGYRVDLYASLVLKNSHVNSNPEAVDGIVVKAFQNSNTVDVYGITSYQSEVYEGTPASFTQISNCTVCNTQHVKAAYMTSSAAIVTSKYTQDSAYEIVNRIDNARTPTGAFSLSRALAPVSVK